MTDNYEQLCSYLFTQNDYFFSSESHTEQTKHRQNDRTHDSNKIEGY
ncbi:unnamed protein product [Tenebrio molitor]|nr:unnamed protein product [Tenebrio molitor]